MSVLTTLYNVLENDIDLRSVLANSTINPEKKAIYDHWADSETSLPYIVMRFDFGPSSHWAKRETSLTIDIFTDGDTVQAEQIRNMIIYKLDRNIFSDPADGAKIRCYVNGDRLLDETDGDEIAHWNIDFSLHHWRNDFIQRIGEKEPPILYVITLSKSNAMANLHVEVMEPIGEIVYLSSDLSALSNISIDMDVKKSIDLYVVINAKSKAIGEVPTEGIVNFAINLNALSTIDSDLLAIKQAEIYINSISDTSGILSGIKQANVAINSNSDASGTLKNVKHMNAIVNSASSVNSDISRIKQMSANSNAISDTSGSISRIKQANVVVDSISNVSVNLSSVKKTSINIHAVSDASGNLNIISIPQQISNLSAWYDASKIALNNNDLVNTWEDLSGNNYHLTSSGVNRPTFKTNVLNGNPVLNFIQQNMLVSFGTTFSQPNTIIFVANQDDSIVENRFFFDSYGSTSRHSIFKHTSGRLDLHAGSTITTTYTPSLGVYFIGNLLFNTTNSIFRVNGVQNVTGNIGTSALTGLILASNLNGSQRLNCNFAEILIYNKVLTNEETNTIEDYLASKYNII